MKKFSLMEIFVSRQRPCSEMLKKEMYVRDSMRQLVGRSLHVPKVLSVYQHVKCQFPVLVIPVFQKKDLLSLQVVVV